VTLLRPLRADDGPALRRLLEATDVFTADEVDVAMELVDGGERDGYFFRVAEEDRQVAGYVCYGPALFSATSWDLYWIVVDPVGVRKGIGSELLAAAESAAAADAARTMLVETASKLSYAPSRRFYEKHGYAEIARVPDFYAEGDDKVVYAKRLDGAPAPPVAAAVAVGESVGRDRGVFALRAFSAGDTIEVAPVLSFSSEEWEEYVVNTDLADYCFRWTNDGDDGAIALGLGSLYNHSYSPSAKYVLRFPEREIAFVALRDIEAGEEITVNYNRDHESQKPVWFDAI